MENPLKSLIHGDSLGCCGHCDKTQESTLIKFLGWFSDSLRLAESKSVTLLKCRNVSFPSSCLYSCKYTVNCFTKQGLYIFFASTLTWTYLLKTLFMQVFTFLFEFDWLKSLAMKKKLRTKSATRLYNYAIWFYYLTYLYLSDLYLWIEITKIERKSYFRNSHLQGSVFFIGIHSMQGWTATTRHVIKNRKTV